MISPKNFPETYYGPPGLFDKTNKIRMVNSDDIMHTNGLHEENNIVGEVLTDNIGGQRSKFDVMAAILRICLEDSLKNHIIGKGNFSDAMANHYLSILLMHGLLQTSKDENSRTYYSTTGKGRDYINHYVEVQKLFKSAKAQGVASETRLTSQSQPSSGIEDPRPLGTKRILVVDDESDIGSAMKIGLEDNGFAVSVFNDPLSALSVYKAGSYDLLILDVKMPKMNGFELYREIRKLDENSKVCFLTAFEMYIEEFKRVFPSMDVKHFIQKPISMADLVEQIKKLTDQ